MIKRICLAGLALLVLAGAASAQVNVKPCTDVTNATLGTHDCLPTSSTNPLQITGPVTATPATPATGSGNSGYPTGSTAVANSAAGTTGAVVATLAAAAGKFTYLCNWQVSAAGGTATISPITIAGISGGSIVIQGISAGGAPYSPPAFTPCLPSSAVNTAITVTTTADGTATAVNVAAAGYQQ